MSSMWRFAVILPVLLAIAPASSAQMATSAVVAAQPPYTTSQSVSYALNDWRNLWQSC